MVSVDRSVSLQVESRSFLESLSLSKSVNSLVCIKLHIMYCIVLYDCRVILSKCLWYF